MGRFNLYVVDCNWKVNAGQAVFETYIGEHKRQFNIQPVSFDSFKGYEELLSGDKPLILGKTDQLIVHKPTSDEVARFLVNGKFENITFDDPYLNVVHSLEFFSDSTYKIVYNDREHIGKPWEICADPVFIYLNDKDQILRLNNAVIVNEKITTPDTVFIAGQLQDPIYFSVTQFEYHLKDD
ncbi:MAG: hypothetical protein AAF502_14525 [Bacteroidota bacterium]